MQPCMQGLGSRMQDPRCRIVDLVQDRGDSNEENKLSKSAERKVHNRSVLLQIHVIQIMYLLLME